LKADPRFRDHAAVTGQPYLRFYAGAPMRARSGHALGTFCVADTVPRQLHATQIDALRCLARQAMALLDLHKANVMPAAPSHSEEQTVQASAAIFDELQHRFRNNLQTIDSLISLQAHQERAPEGRLAIGRLRDRLRPLYLIQDRAEAGRAAAVDLRAYLHDVAQAATERHRGRVSHVEWLEAVDEIQISRDKALPLGLIVNEFFANSFTHAFAGEPGRLEIRLTRLQDRRAVLQLADDGRGFDVKPGRAGGGLGLQLIAALSRQLVTKPVWDTTAGSRLTLEFATG
jgi:two-component sensor histidine kinase